MQGAWRWILLLGGCTGGDQQHQPVSPDPATCAGCHPEHYLEWSGSMHAYASTDPVFRAQNARGQRDTRGALGDDCVRCHAPTAVWLGMTSDGLDLEAVPDWAQGVSCIVCHAAVGVRASGVPLELADDGILRGGLRRPLHTRAHGSTWSPLHDRTERASTTLCGACHPRARQEWSETLFALDLTCGGCHMRGRDGPVAAVRGAPIRRGHSHMVPGVDLAATPFPEREAQREAVQAALDPSLGFSLCVTTEPGATVIELMLENQASGHGWPSCSKDRRAWVELIARDGAGEVVWSTGVVDEQALSELDDPDLWALGDWQIDAEGRSTVWPWEAVRTESVVLPARMAVGEADPRWVDPHVERRWHLELAVPPESVSLRVRFRAVQRDLLDALVEGGDLDPTIRATAPTLDVEPTRVTWTASGQTCIP